MRRSFLILLLLPQWQLTSCFVTRKSMSTCCPSVAIRPSFSQSPYTCTSVSRMSYRVRNCSHNSSSTALPMASALTVAKGAASAIMKPRLRNMLLLLSIVFLIMSKGFERILWPGTASDPNINVPLPPGSFGCPLMGINFFAGTHEYGPWASLPRLRKKLGNPNIFKFFSFGLPLISVSGEDNIKKMLKDEFDPNGDNSVNTFLMGKENLGPIFGDEGILYEADKEKHSMLRRLIGAAMSPSAINAAIPSIQETANRQMEKILKSEKVKMEDICNEFTLDIAWKQILGLDLKEEEVDEFHRKAEEWISGMFTNLFLMVPFHVPGVMKLTKTGRARTYLVSKIEEKLAKLDKNGPDSSSLSALYFARDEDDTSRKLTRTQVIHNALLLIFAGTETSASTLTCASLILSLHPDVWKKIKMEQEEIRTRFGENFTKESLEECIYLESAIKETLRLKPAETGELRKVEKTMVIDGKQIPKKWYVFFNIKQTHVDDPVLKKDDKETHMDIRKGFKPERWNDDNTKPSVWIPFGDGRRRCIGERLAMAEMKIFLGTLARRVDYDLVNNIASNEDIKWKKDTVLARPLDGVEVKARPAAPIIA